MNWLVTVSSEQSAAPYLDWLRSGGVKGVAVCPDAVAPDPSGFNALLLAGGGDVAPLRYGAEPEPETNLVMESRDDLEIDLIRTFARIDRPVFGVCRGIQILNVALGGGLIQHVPRRLEDHARTETHAATKDHTAYHAVTVNPGTALGRTLHGLTQVNSFHHQAIDPARLALGLVVVCTSPAGIIEAVDSRLPGPHMSAVQWHPERLPPGHQASRDLLQLWARIAGGRIRR